MLFGYEVASIFVRRTILNVAEGKRTPGLVDFPKIALHFPFAIRGLCVGGHIEQKNGQDGVEQILLNMSIHLYILVCVRSLIACFCFLNDENE